MEILGALPVMAITQVSTTAHANGNRVGDGWEEPPG